MAITVGQVNTPSRNHVAGDTVMVHCDIAGDASYPTGGSSLTPAMLGLSRIDHIDLTLEAGGTTLAAYDYVNQKVKCFSAFGTEVANATNLSAKTFRVFAVGQGFATLGIK